MQIGLRQRQEHHTVEVHAESGEYRVRIDGKDHRVQLHAGDGRSTTLTIDGVRHHLELVRHGRQRLIAIAGEVYRFEPESGAATAHEVGNVAAPEVIAPMPGKVTQVLVAPGDRVASGDGLVVLEAMKMENRLVAEAAAVVAEVKVSAGDMVDGGQVLVVLSFEAA